ncbi:PEP-CTERM sorting domain-containing protein, partial [Crocosphaera watsonii]
SRGEVHLPVFDGAAAVPEPLTILGAGAAIGFGSAFKRKLAQAKKK